MSGYSFPAFPFVIKDKQTDAYLMKAHCWTIDVEAALSFQNQMEALAYCETRHIRNVVIVEKETCAGTSSSKADKAPLR